MIPRQERTRGVNRIGALQSFHREDFPQVNGVSPVRNYERATLAGPGLATVLVHEPQSFLASPGTFLAERFCACRAPCGGQGSELMLAQRLRAARRIDACSFEKLTSVEACVRAKGAKG